MKRNMLAINLMVCALAVTLIGCSGKVTPNSSAPSSVPSPSQVSKSESNESILASGEMNENVYTNDSLGVTMAVPDGWYIASEEQRMALVESGVEALAKEDKTKQVLYDSAAKKLLTLVYAFEKDPLRAVDTNGCLQLVAEKPSGISGAFIKSPDDYLTAIKAQLETVKDIQGIKASYIFGDVEDVLLNGRIFRMLPIQLQLDDGTVVINQNNYTCFENGYFFLVSSAYVTDEQNKTLNASLSTLKITSEK